MCSYAAANGFNGSVAISRGSGGPKRSGTSRIAWLDCSANNDQSTSSGSVGCGTSYSNGGSAAYGRIWSTTDW
jgi:hypothetical protein